MLDEEPLVSEMSDNFLEEIFQFIYGEMKITEGGISIPVPQFLLGLYRYLVNRGRREG